MLLHVFQVDAMPCCKDFIRRKPHGEKRRQGVWGGEGGKQPFMISYLVHALTSAKKAIFLMSTVTHSNPVSSRASDFTAIPNKSYCFVLCTLSVLCSFSCPGICNLL
jgi:hypothetical protein